MQQTFSRKKSVYSFSSLLVFVGNFFFWNLESWALESGIQLKEFAIQQLIGIWNQSYIEKDPESSIWSPESTTRNLEFEAVLDSLTDMAGWLNAFVYKLKLTVLVKIRFKGSFFSIFRFYFLKRQKHIQFSVMLIEMSLFSWYLSISAWEAKSAK